MGNYIYYINNSSNLTFKIQMCFLLQIELAVHRARTQFPEPNFPKKPATEVENSLLLWEISFCVSQKSYRFLFFFPSSPVNVPLGKCSTVGHGRSGARFPLGPSRPPASYCPRLPSFCAIIVSVLFLAPLRDVLLAAPACYRTHCACFLSLCALFWAASLGRGFG